MTKEKKESKKKRDYTAEREREPPLRKTLRRLRTKARDRQIAAGLVEVGDGTSTQHTKSNLAAYENVDKQGKGPDIQVGVPAEKNKKNTKGRIV